MKEYTNYLIAIAAGKILGPGNDITKCDNESCPLSRKCHRFLSLPSRMQSYARFDYRTDKACFWPVAEPNDKRKDMQTGPTRKVIRKYNQPKGRKS